MTKPEIQPGKVFEVVYPFVLDRCENEDGMDTWVTSQKKAWIPGTIREECTYWNELYQCRNELGIAHGEGKQVLTVIDTYRPKGYETRIFYTSHWIDPDGNRFGKKGLRIMGIRAFRNLLSGYRYPYDVEVEMTGGRETI